MYMCNSVKKLLFVSDFVYWDDFADLREAYWQPSVCLCCQPAAYVPPGPRYPIVYLSGSPLEWLLAEGRDDICLVHYFTPGLCPTVFLGFLGFSIKSPRHRVPRSPTPSWPKDARQYSLDKWVPPSYRAESQVRGKCTQLLFNISQHHLPADDEGGEGRDCVFSVSLNFPQWPRNPFKVELNQRLYNTWSNTQLFCSVNSGSVPSCLHEAKHTPCSLYRHSPWSSLIKWGG